MSCFETLNLLIIIFSAVTLMPTQGFSIVIGLNPALQKRFILSDANTNLIPGNVHRASSIQEGIGGKGQDVAVTLACLQSTLYKNSIHLAQLVGSGPEGDLALSKLNQALNNVHDNSPSVSNEEVIDSWNYLTVRTQAKLRTCTTVVGADSATELVEPSGLVSSSEINALKERIKTISSSSMTIKGLCIMGSMPPGCAKNLYAELYAKIKMNQPNVLSVIDTVVGLDQLFKEMKETDKDGGKSMLKINFAELKRLAPTNESNFAAENLSASLEHITCAISGFFDAFPDSRGALDFIAITNGCHPAYFVSLKKDSGDFTICSISIPDLSVLGSGSSSKVYPIGAGDSVAGGTLAAWEYLQGPSDATDTGLDASAQHALKEKCGTIGDVAAVAFAFGIACGSASCVQEENSVLTSKDALALFEHIAVQTFN